MTKPTLQEGFLPGLPVDLIRAQFDAAPGNEIGSGKFLSPESSSALAANSFGFSLDKPAELPPLPIGDDHEWRPVSVRLEAENRFPWAGGRHPWLDILVELSTAIVGIESEGAVGISGFSRVTANPPAFNGPFFVRVAFKGLGDKPEGGISRATGK
jgi:hypothetical protein